MTRLRSLAVLLLMLPALVGLAAGLAGRLHPAFDTLANFRGHLGAGLAGLGLLLAIAGARRAGAVSLVAGALGLALALPGLPLAGTRTAAAPGETVYRLIAFNLRFDNPRADAVAAMLEASGADILVLSEFSDHWQAPLQRLSATYPHRAHCPEWSIIGGVLILSRHPFTDRPDYCHDFAALLLKEVVIAGTPVAVGSVHLRWPWPASGPRQVEALAPVLGELGADAILAGDFNAATWTVQMARFADHGGLDLVTGLGPTWLHNALPAALAPVVGLPIDHALVKGRVKVVAATVMADAGSDHRPIAVDFVLRDP